MLTATRELLTSLDLLAYRQRLRHVAGWARVSADRIDVCADLRGLGAYERHLALVASMVVGDVHGVEAAVRDPQLSIKAAALGAAVDATVLRPTIMRLAGRGDLGGGLFAIELTRPGATFGWSTPWQDLLLHLRHHPDLDVREEAYTIHMT